MLVNLILQTCVFIHLSPTTISYYARGIVADLTNNSRGSYNEDQCQNDNGESQTRVAAGRL